MVGLDAAGGEDGGGTFVHGFGEQELELANLVAGGGASGLIVAFDVKGLGEVGIEIRERERFDRGGSHAEEKTVGWGMGAEAGEIAGRSVWGGERHLEREGKGRRHTGWEGIGEGGVGKDEGGVAILERVLSILARMSTKQG